MAVLAPVLATGRAEVDQVHPNRDRKSDGTIGDRAHQTSGRPENGGSRHNVNARGRINAWDCDKDGPDMARLVACWRRHPSAQNVIYNRTIWSRSWGWTARAYVGDNPHDQHGHFEARLDDAAERDTRPWGYLAGGVVLVPVSRPSGLPSARGYMTKMPTLRRAPRTYRAAAAIAQRALRKLGHGIGSSGVDGKYGDDTIGAVKAFQRARGLRPVDGVVGPLTWVALVQALLGTGVDGDYGPKTTAAAEAFQRARGLKVDGIVGPVTLARLVA